MKSAIAIWHVCIFHLILIIKKKSWGKILPKYFKVSPSSLLQLVYPKLRSSRISCDIIQDINNHHYWRFKQSVYESNGFLRSSSRLGTWEHRTKASQNSEIGQHATQLRSFCMINSGSSGYHVTLFTHSRSSRTIIHRSIYAGTKSRRRSFAAASISRACRLSVDR